MSEFVNVRTADLTGAALDWAVGKSIGWIEPVFGIGQISYIAQENFLMMAEPDPDEPDDVTLGVHFNHYSQWSPSRIWSQCGPLVSRYLMDFSCDHPETIGAALCDENGMYLDEHMAYGRTHLIAACRAIVVHEFGDNVSVPKELLS